MTIKVGCTLKVYEGNPRVTKPSSKPIVVIELCIISRYQLKMQSNEGVEILLDDVITPEFRTILKVPLVFLIPSFVDFDSYISNMPLSLNLDATIRNYLRPRITKSASILAGRNGVKGFTMVAKVGITKIDCMGKEEVDRIASQLMKTDIDNSLQGVTSKSKVDEEEIS